jgi:hypothetical protein
MANPEREGSMQSSIPPPPPPPLEDSKYLVRYGNGADTYTNNHMADDESVEAQHVVYTFAEEGKSSKKGRKKWICLMLTVSTLLIVIITLGAVYGTQRANRAVGASIMESNQATDNGDNNATDADIDTATDSTDTVETSTIDIDGVDTTVDPDADQDVYETPIVDANSTTMNSGDVNATASVDTTGTTGTTDGDAATVAPTISGTVSGTSFRNPAFRPCNRPGANCDADAGAGTIAPSSSGTVSFTRFRNPAFRPNAGPGAGGQLGGQ